MEKILKLFLFHNKLKFSEIEKITGIRSNKVSYYLKKLIQKSVIEKQGDFYSLTESSEFIIPYLSEKKAVLPVVLIVLEKNKRIFLHKRSKRPYKKDWGLKEILSIMKKNAGREFNPFLVDNFSSMLMKALHES